MRKDSNFFTLPFRSPAPLRPFLLLVSPSLQGGQRPSFLPRDTASPERDSPLALARSLSRERREQEEEKPPLLLREEKEKSKR